MLNHTHTHSDRTHFWPHTCLFRVGAEAHQPMLRLAPQGTNLSPREITPQRTPKERLYGALVAAVGGSTTAGYSPRLGGALRTKLYRHAQERSASAAARRAASRRRQSRRAAKAAGAARTAGEGQRGEPPARSASARGPAMAPEKFKEVQY